MIAIDDILTLDESEISESFIRASGPGGQNVNKVASAVQLRFDARRSPSLPEPVRRRLERLGGRRVTQDGVLVITAQRFRSQERNRADALMRLVEQPGLLGRLEDGVDVERRHRDEEQRDDPERGHQLGVQRRPDPCHPSNERVERRASEY